MPDYSQAKIYKLKSASTPNIYVGSTCKTIDERFNKHKKNYRYYLKNKDDPNAKWTAFIRSYDVLKYDDCTVELIEEFPCQSKRQLIAREAHYIRTLPHVINVVIPDRTPEEYYIANRQRISERKKQYYLENKDYIKQRVKNYYHQRKKLIEDDQHFLQQQQIEQVDNAVPITITPPVQ